MSDQNEHVILIAGDSSSGKSASLRNLRNQERWLLLNCEPKKLPIKNRFHEIRITDPYDIFTIFQAMEPGGEEHANYDGVIIDSVTFLMDMYFSRYVRDAADSQKMWGLYAEFFKDLVQLHINKCDKAVIVTGHNLTELDEAAGIYRSRLAIQGQIGKGKGAEAYFSTVVGAKKIPLKQLAKIENNMLEVSPRDEAVGFKHVFQTDITKETVGERIRSPMGLFEPNELYIDNDAQKLLDHLVAFYS